MLGGKKVKRYRTETDYERAARPNLFRENKSPGVDQLPSCSETEHLAEALTPAGWALLHLRWSRGRDLEQ